MSRISINIPKPCHENWNGMTTADKGRFCGSCQKVVIDFTKLSDRQIAEKVESTPHICGRFRNEQLERELLLPKHKSSIWTAAIAGVVGFLNLGNDTIYAQDKPQTVQNNHQNSRAKMGEVTALPAPRIIFGMISDATDSVVMPAINILNLRTQKSVSSDANGKYEIPAQLNDTLEFTFLGFSTSKIVVGQSDKIDVVLRVDPNVEVSTGIVVTARSRNLFGRAVGCVRNWFR